MSDDNPTGDPIRDATTVSGFLEAIKQKYDPTLPTDFSDDSPVSRLLNSSSPIKVVQGKEENTLYEARGSPLDFIPFNFGAKLEPPLHSIVIITVTQESA